MTVDTEFSDSICQKIKEYKDNCNVVTFDEEYKKVLNLTSLSVKTFANALSKDSTYLESNDIDRIKNSLISYNNKDEKIKAFKDELINDLSEFQRQIERKHNQQIIEYKNQAQIYQRELRAIQNERNEAVLTKLFNIAWPNNSKAKEYENKMATLKTKAETCIKRVTELQSMPPVANEKDILLYQLHLKEKYALKANL